MLHPHTHTHTKAKKKKKYKNKKKKKIEPLLRVGNLSHECDGDPVCHLDSTMALFSAVASSRRIFTTKARASQFTISRLRSKCPISKFIHITSVQRRNSGRPRVVRVHDLQQFPGTSGAKVATTHPPTSGLAAAAAAAATMPLFQLACREQAQQCSRLDIVKSEERERGGGEYFLNGHGAKGEWGSRRTEKQA